MSVVMFDSPSSNQPAGMTDRLLAETVALAEDARAYLINRPAKPDNAAPLPILVETAEISRVTTRISHCMAWLLGRRAVAAGEISAQEALGEEWRLADHDICTAAPHNLAALTPVLQRLSERSLALFERIARLDRQLDR